jgi:hypothetical protein
MDGRVDGNEKGPANKSVRPSVPMTTTFIIIILFFFFKSQRKRRNRNRIRRSFLKREALFYFLYIFHLIFLFSLLRPHQRGATHNGTQMTRSLINRLFIQLLLAGHKRSFNSFPFT